MMLAIIIYPETTEDIFLESLGNKLVADYSLQTARAVADNICMITGSPAIKKYFTNRAQVIEQQIGAEDYLDTLFRAKYFVEDYLTDKYVVCLLDARYPFIDKSDILAGVSLVAQKQCVMGVSAVRCNPYNLVIYTDKGVNFFAKRYYYDSGKQRQQVKTLYKPAGMVIAKNEFIRAINSDILYNGELAVYKLSNLKDVKICDKKDLLFARKLISKGCVR